MEKQGGYILFGVTVFVVLFSLAVYAQQVTPAVKADQKADSPKTSSSGILSYPTLKKAIKSAYEYRASLLQHSLGKAQITLQVEYDSEHADAMPERASGPLVLDSRKREPLIRQSRYLVEWYKNEGKKRNDIAFQPVPDQQEREVYEKKNIRSAMDSAKSIYYDLDKNTAYIDGPPRRAGNPLGLYNDFDILYFYTFGKWDLPGMLDRYEKAGITPIISEDTVGEVKCLKLTFSGIDTEGKTWETLFWLAKDQAYALVKDDSQKKIHIESTYVESKEFPGVWVLHTQHYEDASFPGHTEKLHVAFSEQKIGVPLSEKVFTFEGMEVPFGIPLYDRRVRGKSSKRIDGENMKVGLDEIVFGQQTTK